MRVFVMMAMLGLAAPLVGLTFQPAQQSDLRLVFLAPWQDAEALAQSAGGTLVGPQRATFAALVQTDDPARFDDLAMDFGAFGVRDGAAIAALCGVVL
ncbi:hypothetical protein KUV51_16705 [Tateyamaria omphalii]|uniref:hypothetical protein n=1 Tax=Tateyamaria omphalii TaxID=299262 RepID=UPI001C9A0B49|nr:hypothetical protein [Tateyamaria omphalii]MBY5934650.1 hypothetical protein [Tateyamaria omphalii]